MVSGKFLSLQIAREGALGVKRRRNAEDPAEGRALRFAVVVSVTLLLFSVLAHWIPFGGVPKGGAAFNQLTVAQFLGGVGGGIGAVIVGATLWLQLRALGDLRWISQVSHQFEAYALWRDIDESIDDELIRALGNVTSALAAKMKFGVELDEEKRVQEKLGNYRVKGWRVDHTEILGQTKLRIYEDFVELVIYFRPITSNNLVNKAFETESFVTSVKRTFAEVAEFLNDILFFEIAEVGNAHMRRDTPLAQTLDGRALTSDDARRVREFSNRVLLHLDEAEQLGCAAQCRARISATSARLYLGILARIGVDQDARDKLYTSLSDVSKVQGGIITASFDDLQRWQNLPENSK